MVIQLNRPGLQLRRHRGTTAHISSAYPFQAESGLGHRGVYLGFNLLTGGGGFAYDPFEAYAQGLVTNPNMLIAGEPGMGKSACAKTFLYRSIGVYGRWAAIADPKGEYLPLADALGLSVIKLYPGGPNRINPLDPGPMGMSDPDELARRQTSLLAALLGSVLKRDLTPVEDAVLGWSLAHLAASLGGRVTLNDVALVLRQPTEEMAARAQMSAAELSRQVDDLSYALGKLLDRTMRGMFDGHTNINLDWNGPGIVIDLSAVHHDQEALTLVLLATQAWLQAIMSGSSGPRRIQVLDEAWALLGSERTAKYLQACWKLSRAYGVANLAIVHRISDLRAQADDGSSASKVSMGLLADTQTRIFFRQSSDQVDEAQELLGLTSSEAELLTHLTRGRALWKVAGHAAVVQHVIGRAERHITDSDARMKGDA